jgi:type II secretory ATPase GspE/PulE/Tfp pilus assembly ATPase PilB-like protein
VDHAKLPQDGRFRVKKDGREIDFRVSTVPMSYGEKVVIRILDKGNLKFNMKELGIEPEELEKFEKLKKLLPGTDIIF